MPRLDRAVTLKLIDIEFGLSAARDRGERPPNGVALLAEATGIPRRTLSGAVYGSDQVADYRIVLIANALKVKTAVIKSRGDKDDEEAAEPQREQTAPPRRKNGSDDNRRPKRVHAA